MTTLTLDRHKGHAFSYDVVDLGFNYRMTELNAALGLCQLSKLMERNAIRARHVVRYRELLGRIDGLQVPFSEAPGDSSFHIMPVLLPPAADRLTVMTRMRQVGVQTSIHYRPVDTFSAYEQAGLGPCTHLVQTREIGAREVTLPLYPSMSDAQIETVCRELDNALTG
jgi:dTDP-4-amino-4,6-dideoxygalactose transaminase